jgi:hypothetical protein
MAEPFVQIEENAFNVTYPMSLGCTVVKTLFGPVSDTDVAIGLVTMNAWCSDTEYRLRDKQLHPTPVPVKKEITNKARLNYAYTNYQFSMRCLKGFGDYLYTHRTTADAGQVELKLDGDVPLMIWTDFNVVKDHFGRPIF